MTGIDYYRLEYNEKKGMFHSDDFSKRKDDQFEWETIAMVISNNEVNRFVESVLQTYPQVNSGKGDSFPSAKEIVKLYNKFIGISNL